MRNAALVLTLVMFLPWLVALVAVAESLAHAPNWLFLKTWPVLMAATMTLRISSFGILILLRRLPTVACRNSAV